MRKLIVKAFALAALLAISTVACGGNGGGSSGQDSLGTIKIGTLRSEALAGPLWTADSQGYWDDLGVKVELTIFDNGTQMVQALQGGSLDGAVAGAAVVSGIAVAGNGQVTFPSYVETNTNKIYSLPDSGIETAADLGGVQVALPKGTTAHVLLAFAADANGIAYSDLDVVNTKYTDTPAVLARGAVPAGVITGTTDELIHKEVPDIHLVTSLSDYYPDRAVFGGLLFSNDVIAKRAAAVQAATTGMMVAYSKLAAGDEELHNAVWEAHFKDVESRDAYNTSWNSASYPTLDEWKTSVADGSVLGWANDTASVLNDLNDGGDFTPSDKAINTDIFEASLTAAQSTLAGS